METQDPIANAVRRLNVIASCSILCTIKEMLQCLKACCSLKVIWRLYSIKGSMERSLSEDLDLVNVQIEEYWAEEWMELIMPVYHKGKSWSKIV